MPRDWTAYEASQEEAAFGRWAEEFLNELQAKLDYARAVIFESERVGRSGGRSYATDSPYDAVQAIKTFVLDDEVGIP